MSVCTYDNPATMQRECWQDGRLLCAYSAEFWALKRWRIPAHIFFFGANVGDWKTGQLFGDIDAMDATEPRGTSQSAPDSQ